MVDNGNGQNIDFNQYDPKRQHSSFNDDNLVEDVDSVQEPYPANDMAEDDDDMNDITDDDDMIDGEADNENENNIHEYEDNDHPHEYRPPSATVDDYEGASDDDDSNAFEQQNPLQSTYPSSNQDR